jgi:hypothetical protein
VHRHSRPAKLIATRQNVVTKSCRVNTGGDSTREGVVDPSRKGYLIAVDCRVIARAALVTGSTSPTSFSFFSIRLKPAKLARVWLMPAARHVCELSHSSYFRDLALYFRDAAFCRAAANPGPDVSFFAI